MSRVRSKDTKPELMLRRALWAKGYRYRLHHPGLIGKPDIVFVGPKVVVFVDGDFWHGNAWRVRELDSLADLFPTNTDWWVEKIQGNMDRDERVTEELEEEGWSVLRIWESEILSDLAAAVARVEAALEAHRQVQ